jgi:hypothetical protein
MATSNPVSLIKAAAARYVVGAVTSDWLREIANTSLEAGLYSPCIAEIATADHPILSEVGPLFEKAVGEVGLAMPSRQQALWDVASFHLRRISDGEVVPRRGLAELLHDLHDDLYEDAKEFFADSLYLHNLMGCYYGYDDLEERPNEVSFKGKYGNEAMAAVDAEIVEMAREWLSRLDSLEK